MNWLLRLWVKFKIRPEDVAERLHARNNPVCYVLEERSAVDLAVLQDACVRLKLTRPRKRLIETAKDLRSFFYLSRPRGFWDERLDRRPPPQLRQMVEALRADPNLDIDLVPVAVYWSRAPQKERSWFRLLFVEDWALTSRARRFMQVLFNGRDVIIEFDDPISLRSLLGDRDAGQQIGVAVRGRRVARALRTLYAKHRAARIGPDLSHRRTIVTRCCGRAPCAPPSRRRCARRSSRATRPCCARSASPKRSRRTTRTSSSGSWRLAIPAVEPALRRHRVRARRDAGADGGGQRDRLRALPSQPHGLPAAVVCDLRAWLRRPAHRRRPNLNLPIVGRFLRKGGAFFIRRSFRGNALYTVVFMKYLAAIMARGHSIEYFIEGGRSRTGRLLQPKTGMLSMTVRSYLREPRARWCSCRSISATSALSKATTYIGELSGKPKEKESVFGLLRALARAPASASARCTSISASRSRSPRLLDRSRARLARADSSTTTRAALGEPARSMSWRGAIMRNINSAAAVTPINLLA